MAETPRSSFRLRKHTLQRIEEIQQYYRQANRYDAATKTDIIERAVDELHRWLLPPADKPRERNRR
jgi:hypothetical protein